MRLMKPILDTPGMQPGLPPLLPVVFLPARRKRAQPTRAKYKASPEQRAALRRELNDPVAKQQRELNARLDRLRRDAERGK
jgi:hypothetical protein